MNTRGRALLGLLVGALLLGGWGSRTTTAGAETLLSPKGVKGSIKVQFSWKTDPPKNGLGIVESEDCQTEITFSGGMVVEVSGEYTYTFTDTTKTQKSDGEHTIVRKRSVTGKIPKRPTSIKFNFTIDRHYVFGYVAYEVSYFQPTWDSYMDERITDNGKDIGEPLSDHRGPSVGCAIPKQRLLNVLRIEGTEGNPNAVHFSGKEASRIQNTPTLQNRLIKDIGTYTLHWDLTTPSPAKSQG